MLKSSWEGTAVCVDPCVENWHFIAEMVREGGGFHECVERGRGLQDGRSGIANQPNRFADRVVKKLSILVSRLCGKDNRILMLFFLVSSVR
jgi:hypothetical protein